MPICESAADVNYFQFGRTISFERPFDKNTLLRRTRMKYSASYIAILLAGVLFAGCDSESLDDSPDDIASGVIQIGGFDSADLRGDTFEINSARVVGTSLELNVSYAGGCSEHDFVFYTYEAIILIYPPQLSIHAVHDGNGDQCEAYITRDVSVELGDLETLLSGPFFADIIKNDSVDNHFSFQYSG